MNPPPRQAGESLDAQSSANEPKLQDAHLPFDPQEPPSTVRGWLEAYRAVFAHLRKYGLFSVPETVDRWNYRSYLRALDPYCLRALHQNGALTTQEMSEWVSRNCLKHTKPDKTGIRSLTAATSEDWVAQARRRDLVTAWPGDGAEATPKGEELWAATDSGRAARHLPLRSFMSRVPLGRIPSLIPSLLASGAAAAVVAGVGKLFEQTSVLFYVGSLLLYIGLLLWLAILGGRRRPDIAVVAIETLRSSGKPLPSITGTDEQTEARNSSRARGAPGKEEGPDACLAREGPDDTARGSPGAGDGP